MLRAYLYFSLSSLFHLCDERIMRADRIAVAPPAPLMHDAAPKGVRALHLAPRCTLHTYSIGCAASQRNNIATIHHTPPLSIKHLAVSATLALFLRSSSLSCTFSRDFLPRSFSFYYLFYSRTFYYCIFIANYINI